jgi:hypothetical protein
VGKTRAVGLQALYRGARHTDSIESQRFGFGCGTCVEAESDSVRHEEERALTHRLDVAVREKVGASCLPHREGEREAAHAGLATGLA